MEPIHFKCPIIDFRMSRRDLERDGNALGCRTSTKRTSASARNTNSFSNVGSIINGGLPCSTGQKKSVAPHGLQSDQGRQMRKTPSHLPPPLFLKLLAHRGSFA